MLRYVNTTMGPEENNVTTQASPQRRRWIEIGMLAVLLSVVVAGYLLMGDRLSLESLANREVELRQHQIDSPILTYVIAFVAYVGVTGLSLPGATGLTLLFGWYFGFWRGLVLVSFASTSGAMLAFLFSRTLLRNTIQSRFGDRLGALNEALEREGAFYLFTLRLIPAIPFFIVNAVMGLTPMRPRTFWWVSQLGMLPGTIIYVYAGSSVPSLRTLVEKGVDGILSVRLLVALVALGVVPWIVKKALQRFHPSSSGR